MNETQQITICYLDNYIIYFQNKKLGIIPSKINKIGSDEWIRTTDRSGMNRLL